MVRDCCRLGLIALSLFCAAPGCDAAPESVSIASRAGPQRAISDQERQAALALSLGNLGVMNETTSPYSRAMLCVIALEALSRRLEEIDTGSADAPNYSEVLQRSIAIYSRQVRSIAVREGKLAQQVAQDRRQHEMQVPELSSRGQIAINCLRRLAGPGSNAAGGLD
jgi:hypothetical protein